MSVFGQIITAKMVADAVKASVQKWVVTYLAEIARINGVTEKFQPFLSYPTELDLTKYPEDMLPALVTVCPGTTKTTKRGAIYEAEWSVGLGIVLSGQNESDSYQLVTDYTAAVRALLVQHPALDVPWVTGLEYIAERYDNGPLRTEDTRTLGLGSLALAVTTMGVVDASQGPLVPIDDGSAPGDWPTVELAGVTVTGQEISQ